MKITLNTNLCNIVVPDTYGTFSCDHFREEDYSNLVFWREELNMDVLTSTMRNAATTAWNSVSHHLEKCGVKFLCVGDFVSPREYNFTTDSFDLHFEVDREKALKYILRNLFGKKSVTEYMSENYKSRSGFISLMPDCVEELVKFVQEDQHRGFAALIMLCLNEELSERELDGIREGFLEDVYSCRPIIAKNVIDEDLERLYNDDYRMDQVYCYMRYIWRDYQLKGRFDGLSAQTDGYNDIHCPKNNAADLILWAHNNGYTAKQLCDFAGVSFAV